MGRRWGGRIVIAWDGHVGDEYYYLLTWVL
jgi:hypothetical protein